MRRENKKALNIWASILLGTDCLEEGEGVNWRINIKMVNTEIV
jgi:hypothetical protein